MTWTPEARLAVPGQDWGDRWALPRHAAVWVRLAWNWCWGQITAVERDLEVAFGLSRDVRQEVYLLANGRHEANFWLGWHLVSSFRRSAPLKAVAFVADLPAAPGIDSHAVIDRSTYTTPTDGPPRAITLDITRRRSRIQSPVAGDSDVKIALTCLTNGDWTPCECEQSHRSAIVAIDPEVDLSDPADPRQAAMIAAISPRMKKAITKVAPQIGADAVLWIACDGIESSAETYTAFLQTATHAIHRHTAGLEQRYLAFTGPVVLVTLLGVHLSKRGRWSFLAFNSGAYSEVPDPRGRPAKPAPVSLKPTLKNYTPHPLKFVHDGQVIDLPSLGTARCQERVANIGFWDAADEIPRVRVGYGDVFGLPEPEDGVVYIVSQLVVNALPRRSDLAYPHELHRDSTGTITGFSALAVPEWR
jgi:hypothetical protein